MLVKSISGLGDSLLKILVQIAPGSFLEVLAEPKPEPKPQPQPKEEPVTWSAFVEAVKKADIEFPALRPYILAQAILECGRGTTKLFSYKNPFGMHYHEFLKQFGNGVAYVACDGPGIYAEFVSFDAAIHGYFSWFDNWNHYGDWRKHARLGGETFLKHIIPHYCPPGVTEGWKAAHGGLDYVQYVCQKLLPEANKLLGIEEPKPPTSKKIIALDSGHSISEPGAHSKHGAKEEVLNLLQASWIKATLEKAGHEVRLVAGKTNDLVERGEQAKGCDMFVSLHHNSYDGESDPGTEVFCTTSSSKECQAAAKKVCDKISATLNATNRGVKLTNYTVIKTAQAAGCPVVMLVESYFVNPYTQDEAEARSHQAADAIASALLNVLN